jgi:hypothetical protein
MLIIILPTRSVHLPYFVRPKPHCENRVVVVCTFSLSDFKLSGRAAMNYVLVGTSFYAGYDNIEQGKSRGRLQDTSIRDKKQALDHPFGG